MTQHSHQHSDQNSHQHSHQHGDDVDLATILDLDAEVLGGYLDALTKWTRELAPAPTRRIIDVGAGTGTGSLALARRFDTARVVAIDNSPAMLGRLGDAAKRHDLDDRINTVLADLDAAWPDLESADVAWAVSSMHHFADPDRVLRDVFAAVRPGGLAVVVEMDDLPFFLPRDVGFGRPGLEERLHETMAAAGWNPHPNWQPYLERAGFADVREEVFTIDVDPALAGAGTYAHAFLRRCRNSLGDRVAADDAAALDRLVDAGDPAGVLSRADLTIRGTRTAWAARRP
ncbi:class I SAM-dependent methyltransferase [Spelaeicoccus albus]|uniref:SAM-dependent methyltransferase n=1 Tax=Spelaeicoccus albus TaxID=1280376 RepID=A0A7Z0AAK4_9MICO|nr:class I SAM-dependent methyltransferase [Spelaeicoccus albus]NYI66661.1 SAM-dependent methyltransferase [Spelaeicoccus albus]